MNMNVVIIMKLFYISNCLKPFNNVRFLSFESMEGISELY
jgi:hypothetical protein